MRTTMQGSLKQQGKHCGVVVADGDNDRQVNDVDRMIVTTTTTTTTAQSSKWWMLRDTSSRPTTCPLFGLIRCGLRRPQLEPGWRQVRASLGLSRRDDNDDDDDTTTQDDHGTEHDDDDDDDDGDDDDCDGDDTTRERGRRRRRQRRRRRRPNDSYSRDTPLARTPHL